ncbi:protein lines [Sitodiplosis mosellana]|uniref:protein lines n=1 Tax=Sitodiplosis mosellana TaxID=263140 RepID=UPI0024447A7E|nr:protein lines [Sitodiplosis mosellana]XP_055314103.1 protein lines [Sitodiplosis mosellana]XP_055314104.1 protein lines [Sitodiplosis mosellana]XP_055314105.1 protein lines [Sitodiplosis mosellana]
MSSNVTNEQPMSKRQKIDAAENKKGTFCAISSGTDMISDSNTPPDILPMTKHEHKRTTNGSPNCSDSSKSISTTPVRGSPPESPSDELDNAAICNAIKSIEQKIDLSTENGSHCITEFPDLLKTSPDVASTSRSHEMLASTAAPDCSRRNSSTNTHETSSRLGSRDSNSFSRLNNVDEFQLFLMKQCLCDIDEQSLRRPFATLYYRDMNGRKYNVPLKEWPNHQLIQFLSNMELLFEVYLNQNAKGDICTRVMQVCDALLLKEEIIHAIFELDEYNNKFVQYLAIKVLANCLLIVKDKEIYCEELLTTLMSNLVTHHEPTDHRALGKVSFTLGIILHIMEWKDIKKHPLDGQIIINGREVYNDSDNESYSLPANTPQIQDNYFAVLHGDDETETPLAPTPPAESLHMVGDHQNREHDRQSNTSQGSNDPRNFSCHMQHLSDSESFDSNQLKVSILVRLKPKWTLLVQNMAKCVTLLQSNRNLNYIENTITTFLTLWERIISVDTCIEYDQTLPFHKYLTKFTDILIDGKLPIQIYKQMLTLFSASLCYTTTLALQPEVPAETNDLATQLFSSVRESRRNIFMSLPTHEIEPQNNISFIGYKHSTIVYEISSDLLSAQNAQNDERSDDDSDEDSDIELELNEHFNKSIDSTLLQKLVLLVLKAIAVTVRPIGGGDSSDSSMDSVSSNNSSVETAEHDWSFIEHATRDAIEKLQIFLRNKLNFHPETHLSKVIVHLFSNQDDYLLEAMLCMLGTTIAFLPRQLPFGNAANRQANSAGNDRPQFRMLIEMISPVYTFLEFLEIIEYGMETMLDLLLTDETCFLLYFLRFLKYIRSDWTMFQSQCNRWQSSSNAMRTNSHSDQQPYKRVMDVLISLRLKLDRLVFQRIFPYEIAPLLLLMRQCESLYEGNYGLF